MKRVNQLGAKILIVLIVIIISSKLYSQGYPTDPGSTIVTGGLSFSSMGGDLYEFNGDRLSLIQLNPAVCFFIAPGLAFGGSFVLERLSQGNISLTSWGIGPRILYFIGGERDQDEIKGTTYPFVGFGFILTKSTISIEGYSGMQKETITGNTIAFGGGFCRMLSDSIGLITEAGYNIDNQKLEGYGTIDGNKINIIIGLSYFLY